jgi:hypothetical protein
MKRTIHQSLLAALIIFTTIFLLAYLLDHSQNKQTGIVHIYHTK